jgi:hypothetical protein
MTREQFVMAEIIALEDARRMAATLHDQVKDEADERVNTAVQLPDASLDRASTGTGPVDPARQTPGGHGSAR